MTTIAGFVSHGTAMSPLAACRSMLAALDDYGPGAIEFRCEGPACFGRSLTAAVPEDDHDRQPLIGAGGRWLMVADARIDNRDEMGARLGWSAERLREQSDADVLMAAWERWGLAAIGDLLGDIALAAWDADRDELTLVRAPLALRPLFYDDRADHVAFASMPAGLLVLDGNARRLNLDGAAAYLSRTPRKPGPTTMFQGIMAVPQGHAVIIRGGARRTVRLWDLDSEPLNISVSEAGEAMRAELDRAVAARLRRRGGRVACQLSAGRDSGAVAASASLLLGAGGDRLVALTSAPRLGFDDGINREWLSDESGIAARAAERGGMEHVICRPGGGSFAALLDRHSAIHFEAIGNPANLPWLDQISRQSAAAGASVLLGGLTGNLTISAGGTQVLPDYWRERGAISWWRLARGLAGHSPARWRHMINFTFAPFVPHAPYKALLAAIGKRGLSDPSLPTLKGELRERAERIRRDAWHEARPDPSYRAWLRSMLLSVDQSEKSDFAMWGVDVRDPTSDRRLAELCWALPVEAYVAPGQPRPAYAAAFGGRVDPEVIAGARPGYQAADWFEFIDPADVAAAFDRYFRHPVVEALLDRPTIDALVAAWPSRRGYERLTVERYNNQLLRTMALASFVSVNFPDG